MIYVLLVAHFVADFICQSDWMAVNKSKRWDALAWHVAAYTAVIGVLTYALAETLVGWLLFVVGTALSHFATDAVTSRITSRLWFLTPVPTGEQKFRKDAPWYSFDEHSTRDAWADTFYIDKTGNRHWFFVVIGADQLLHYVTLLVTAGWWL